MQAIVNIAGSQFRVAQNDEVVVPLLEADPETTLEFDDVIMTIDGETINTSGKVTATVIEHGRDGKVIIFHKKRRKGMRRMRGHRQEYTKIRVTGISA